MINLNRDSFVGKGLHRECYIHPTDENLCIKVVVNGDQRETKREISYYQHLQRRQIDWSMLPKFYGFIETDMGPGAIFDLIRDCDGQVSKPLQVYLDDAELTNKFAESIQLALENLKSYLLENRIVTMTIHPKNILFQIIKDGPNKLFIIDNIGNSDFLPICNHIRHFAEKKIHRKWGRFVSKMLETYVSNPIVKKILS